MRTFRSPSFSRLTLFLSLSVSLLAVCAQPAVGQLAPKTFKHIAVIILDDVGVDQLSCYGEGADFPATPNICKLAANGVLYRNAWANPTCSPTRSTIQTGRYTFRTGVTAPGIPLPLEERTLPEVLADELNKQLGFATAAIGKWHLSGGNFTAPPCNSTVNPQDHGYDYAAGTPSNVRDYFRWCRSVNGVSQVCEEGGGVPECADQPYATIVNVTDALSWIGKRGGAWFLWMAFNAPHAPFQAPPDQCPTGPCHGVALPVPPGERCTGDPRPCYKAMMETLDTEIGRLLDYLPDDTAVILLGDNGSPSQVVVPPFDPTRAKFSVYEGGVNVPLILDIPGLATQGVERKELVNASDLFATVLDLAGAKIPPDLVTDSRSLVPILQGTAPARTYVFTEMQASTQPGFRKTAREKRYKLIRTPNASPEDIEFFDLAGDPFETKDLYDDAQPNLTQMEQEAFDDLQEYLDFLDGVLPACPPTRSCTNPEGTCARDLGQECQVTGTGSSACVQTNGELFQCGPGGTIFLRNCPCRVLVPHTICLRSDQTFFCQF
jgi:arylsulfatase B